MPTCPSWALSVSQGTLPGIAMNGKRAGGSQGQEETQELQGPSWEEGQSASHQAAPRQGWPKGTWRMLLESGRELLREAPKTHGKGCARGPRVPARSQQQPWAWGSARVHGALLMLCRRVCAFLGIKQRASAMRDTSENTAVSDQGRRSIELHSPIWHQEGFCSRAGAGAVSCLFPGRFSKFPRNLTLCVCVWGGCFTSQRNIHKN